MDRPTPDGSPSGCPGRAALLGFDTGGLPDDDMEAVALHLSTCQECASAYKGISQGTPADALDDYLRRPASEAWKPDGPGYEAMEAAARALWAGGPAAGATTLAAAPGAVAPAAAPDAIGPYVVRHVLGSGGMGVVYEATHAVLGRTVALKMIREATLERPDALTRFRTEAAAVARLRHPNVVEVVHFDEWHGLPYLVMEKVDGKTLSRLLVSRGGSLPAREAAGLVRQLADAVEYAHSKKVLHRDLKPGNVMVAADGTPKIADFGLAKLQDDGQPGPTAADTVLGTPSYMAPEQARGDVAGVGPAADVYSLGAILYECLAGRPPFRGGNKNATLDLVLRTAPKPPSEVNPGVPAVLEAVCLKCLSKSPADRYPSAAALAADLGRWLDGTRTAVRPPGWFGRNRRWVAAAALIAGGLAGGGVAAVTFDPDRPRREITARLDRGESVELIPAIGGPKWSDWVIGGSKGHTHTADDGTYTVSTWGSSLVELAPDPRTDRYRFKAEVRHRNSDVPGGVGLYVARRAYAGGRNDVNYYVEAEFNDVAAANAVGGATNLVTLAPRLQSEGGVPPNVNDRFAAVNGPAFQPSRGAVWHELALTVTPEGVTAEWDGHQIPLPAASLAGVPDHLSWVRRLRPGNDVVNQLQPAFAPRGGLGISVYRGSVSIRSAVLTPIPGGAN